MQWLCTLSPYAASLGAGAFQNRSQDEGLQGGGVRWSSRGRHEKGVEYGAAGRGEEKKQSPKLQGQEAVNG